MRERLNWFHTLLGASGRKTFTDKCRIDTWKDRGAFSAPASAAHYPILKSLQYSLLMAGMITVVSLVGTLMICGTTPAPTYILGYSIMCAAIAFFLGMTKYWLCLFRLVSKLAENGHLGKLAVSSEELYMSIHKRSFTVEASKQEVIERIVAALSSHPNMKINRLDIFNGAVEAWLMSEKVIRSVDMHFRLSEEENGATKVDILSRPQSVVIRYSGDIMYQSLPILFDLEDAIKRPGQKAIINESSLKPPRFWLHSYQYAALIWVCAITMLSVSSTALSLAPNSNQVDAETMMEQSNYVGATQKINEGIAAAKKLSDPADRKSELADALTLRAEIVCNQFEDKFLLRGSNPGKSPVHLSDEIFERASDDIAKAITFEPRFTAAYITKARLLGLHGDRAQAEQALDEAEKALGAVDKPGWCDGWTDKIDLRYARAMVYAAQNDIFGALPYLQESEYCYGASSIRSNLMRVRLLASQDNANSHLSVALKDAKKDLRASRHCAMELDPYTSSETEDSTSDALRTLAIALIGIPALLTYLLKDWYRVGAKDPLSAPAPKLYAGRKKHSDFEQDSDQPPYDSLAEHFEQLQEKMKESLSSISLEQGRTMDLAERIAEPGAKSPSVNW